MQSELSDKREAGVGLSPTLLADRPVLGSEARIAGVKLAVAFHALPGLRLSDERDPKVSPHDQRSSAIGQGELTAVNTAAVRIQYVAADILVALQPHIAYQNQPDDRLVPAFIGTSRAFLRAIIGR